MAHVVRCLLSSDVQTVCLSHLLKHNYQLATQFRHHQQNIFPLLSCIHINKHQQPQNSIYLNYNLKQLSRLITKPPSEAFRFLCPLRDPDCKSSLQKCHLCSWSVLSDGRPMKHLDLRQPDQSKLSAISQKLIPSQAGIRHYLMYPWGRVDL